MGFFSFLKQKELNKIVELESLLNEFKSIRDINEKVKSIENDLNITIQTKETKIIELQLKIEKLDEIINLDDQINSKKVSLDNIINMKQSEIANVESQFTDLRGNYINSKELYSKLRREITLYENKLDLVEYGIYDPIYDFEKSDDYRVEQESIRDQLKLMLKSETAATCSVNWTIDGSTAKGKSSTKRLIKLVLRAFNGEADATIAKVKWNNVNQMIERIHKSFDSINKLGEGNAICISYQYRDLKVKELKLEYEYLAKKQQEKEEMRAIQEELREEEKAKREYERVQRESEKEEALYRKALEKVRREFGFADLETQNKLQEQITFLEAELEEARLRKERAISMAQQTKRGHVYIISNIGSFGENVFKIGMTRRLEPTDRVRELGDASVPFKFDIHAMIYSDEARTLEYELHKAFADKKVNMLNYRREFFNVTLEEIENKIKELGFEAQFTLSPEAMEYRETQVILEKLQYNEPVRTIYDLIEEEFPSEI